MFLSNRRSQSVWDFKADVSLTTSIISLEIKFNIQTIEKTPTRAHSFSKKANFPKNEHFLPPDAHAYVCVTSGKKC